LHPSNQFREQSLLEGTFAGSCDFNPNMQVESKAEQKLRGGFYTPDLVGRFLANWAIRSSLDNVLEPSCGDGALVRETVTRLVELGVSPSSISSQLMGVELFPEQAKKAAESIKDIVTEAKGVIHVGDFFQLFSEPLLAGRQFDAVIGNPPFLRYQSFPEEQKKAAFQIMDSMGVRSNRLTNSWVAFLIASACKLNDTGRLAMVIPAELLQVNYAATSRSFLTSFFDRITVICFHKLLFPSVQQEVVLVLAERKSLKRGFEIIEVEDAADLEDFSRNSAPKAIQLGPQKWTKYLLEAKEIDLLDRLSLHPSIGVLGDVGEVDVGLVTGNNSFFALSPSEIADRNLFRFSEPLVGRTSQLKGLAYTEEDRISDEQANVICNLLRIREVDTLDSSTRRYISWAAEREMNLGYKCRIRRKWYVVPSVWTPDAFLYRQIHLYPKLVANETIATSTDTVHRVRLRADIDKKKLAGCFLNSLTFAYSEIQGRSYGGGVLELEPNEANQLPVPYSDSLELDFYYLDRLEREGNIPAILAYTDKLILKDQLGLMKTEISMLRQIWQKLSSRRTSRKKGKK
jgi:adenine-specific DNA-methyltransferase